MIDWPIKSDVRRKCPIFSESSSESIDRNILSGTVRKSGKDDICPWQWSDFRLFRPLKTDSRLNYRTKYRTLLLISKPHSSNKTTIHVDIILYWTVLIDKYCTDSGQNDSSAGHNLFWSDIFLPDGLKRKRGCLRWYVLTQIFYWSISVTNENAKLRICVGGFEIISTMSSNGMIEICRWIHSEVTQVP